MKLRNIIYESSSVFWFIGVLIILWTIFSPGFFRLSNMENLLIQASPLLILAIAETIAILSEGIDLSVGYILGFSGLIGAYFVKAEYNLFIIIISIILTGAIIGLLNGIIIAKGSLPPFIATLGIGNIFFGIGLLMTKGISVPALKDSFRFIAEGSIFGVNLSILLAIIVFGIMWIVMTLTKFGRNVKSLGGNTEALRLSGVNIITAKILVYTVVGALSGFSGLLMAARTASGHPGNGLGWEFDAIAATIIGGTAFSEGFGSINKTVLGVFMITILRNGLNMAGVANMYQFAIIGGVVLLAIIMDISLRNIKQQRKSNKAS